ncbi:hypothetical protein [Wenxinia marina]|uniref:Uncharacterized protein n=1 Tax=Wenxinia marina DSM 24838 TaxID=1123501 RepID=A0A0D0Q251_9RHOB|nr:hypothetical protein [Wenxinia marina]KIQ68609.1 hypothetical protein Wenmar_02880 [Wenxinia marina DSM 24838]GGL67264.1 hypothetical protein GCM10011392_22230 [Wenxinia marina]
MFAFILGLIAGFVTPHLDEPVARPLARGVAKEIPVEPNEVRLVSFMAALLAAALIAEIFDSEALVGLTFGAVLGYFATRLVAAVRRAMDTRGSID